MAQLPAAPSSARVALWRKLRAAGAAGLLNGAWVLPLTEEHRALFSLLAGTVRGQGGSATVFSTTTTTPAEGEVILARFRADRAREYDEFAERCSGFLTEIEKETQLRKFTFAELEEIEDDLEKLSAWIAKIKARDFFPNARMQEAAKMLATCCMALRAFAEKVYAEEGLSSYTNDDPGGPNPDGSKRSLKRREGPRHG